MRSSSSDGLRHLAVAALRLGRRVERVHGHEQRREHARDDDRDQGEGREHGPTQAARTDAEKRPEGHLSTIHRPEAAKTGGGAAGRLVSDRT